MYEVGGTYVLNVLEFEAVVDITNVPTTQILRIPTYLYMYLRYIEVGILI